MVDVFRSRAADRSIDGPIIVEREKIDEVGAVSAALGFMPADSFTGIFDHFAVRWNSLSGINPPAVNFRARKLHPEAGIAGIDTACHACKSIELSARGRTPIPAPRQ